MADPLQASSRATSEVTSLAPSASKQAPAPKAPGSPNSKGAPAPSQVEIERKLSRASRAPPGDRKGADTAGAKSTSPSSTDTESDGGGASSSSGAQGGGGTAMGLGVGQANLASISENEDGDEGDTDEEEDRRTIGSDDRSQMAGLSNEETVLSGYLEKKGERRKTWKKRWFVLRRTTLVYYKNAKEYRLLRMVPLSDVHTCAEVQMKTHSNVFGIVTPKRTYYVRAKSRSEMDQWINKVTEAYEAVKAEGRLRSPSSTTQNDDDSAPTPRGADTPIGPVAVSSGARPAPRKTISQPISIQIPGASSGGQFSPSSYSTTTTQPSDQLSTSYTSQSSGGFSGGHVPPNSAITGAASLPRSPDLAEVDHNLEKLSTGPLRSRAGSQAQSQEGGGEGYFGQPTHRGMQPPPSPAAVMMSSSDEDDYDEGDGGTNREVPPPSSERKVPVPEAGKVIIQGYLMKQGKRKNWRKRFFTLTSRELVYSKSHMDKDRTPRRIPVARILDAMEYDPSTHAHSQKPHGAPPSSPLGGHFNFPAPGAANDAKAADNCFKIITSQRTYLVAAATEDEEIRWLSALQCLLATRRAPPQQPQPPQSKAHEPSTTISPQSGSGVEASSSGLAAPTAQRRPSHGTLPSITSTLIAAGGHGADLGKQSNPTDVKAAGTA